MYGAVSSSRHLNQIQVGEVADDEPRYKHYPILTQQESLAMFISKLVCYQASCQPYAG